MSNLALRRTECSSENNLGGGSAYTCSQQSSSSRSNRFSETRSQSFSYDQPGMSEKGKWVYHALACFRRKREV
ncbi:unnamed protein product [Dibothriocephalus latus]|uniref:Uncharacterized protein n=1 Tax=Dibothriocephalus latus TaxID=60516 RepID=A0A3P6Q4S5_DIBLA|nr:unnamed protein product [Dibothriocephalus latus]